MMRKIGCVNLVLRVLNIYVFKEDNKQIGMKNLNLLKDILE